MSLTLWKALTQHSAETGRGSEDPRLRGRTYHVAFAAVWDRILELVQRRSGWRLVYADEQSGLMKIETAGGWFRPADEVRIRLRLDENALTRVDMRSVSPSGRADLGINARRIGRFLEELDRALGVRR